MADKAKINNHEEIDEDKEEDLKDLGSGVLDDRDDEEDEKKTTKPNDPDESDDADDADDSDEHEDPDDPDDQGDDPDLEAKREARRQERRERKERRRLAEERSRQKIAALEEKIRNLEGHSANTVNAIRRDKIEERVRVLRATYQGSKEALGEINQRIAEATRNNDGDALVKAMEDRDTAIRAMGSAQAEYNEIVRIVQEANNRKTDSASSEEKISPRALAHFQEWNKRHPWFDHRAKDQDSKLVQAVDQQVADEGYDPETEDYWDELTKRVRQVLPHKFKVSNGKRRGPPVQGSGGESKQDSVRRSESVTLSKERIEAIKEAGMWDDPDKRKKMIARYAKYDNSQARSR